MKKSTPPSHGSFRAILLLFASIVIVLSGQTLSAQNCSLSCTTLSQVSLDANCDTEVTYQMILNARMTSCPAGDFRVRVLKYKNGPEVLSSPVVNKSHIGQTLTVEIMDQDSKNKCWGQILVEDKMPPRIECSNDTLYCHEMRSYAGPIATDNCQKAAFLHSNDSYPWPYSGPLNYPWRGGPRYDSYTTSMNEVFGNGNWDDLLYEDLDPEIVFSKAYCYIYMEGGDFHAIELSNFLNANRQLIESWVHAGGKLYINASPNEGGNIDFGFGGVILQYSAPNTYVYSARAADPNHPVFQGPSQPALAQFTPFSVSIGLGYVLTCPPGMNSILVDPDNRDLLVEKSYGAGHVIFGGLVATGWINPQPQARNLGRNILSYLKNVGGADVELTMLDEDIIPLGCSSDEFVKRITRTYIATDASGNQSDPCTYDIYLRRFPLKQDRISFPDDRSVMNENPIQCQAKYKKDKNNNPDPSVTGFPTIDGIPMWPNQDFYCNVTVTYEDTDLSIRECVRTIMRLWTVREWHCSQYVTETYTQVIEIVDEEGPVITLPRDMTVTTSGRTCEAPVNLPRPVVYDSCSFDEVTVDIFYPGGSEKNFRSGQIWLPTGVNEVEYVAYDACWNPSSAYLTITVEDRTQPVAICDQHTVVGLTYDGYADAYAATFDDGSYDDCWLDSIAVRRMDAGAETCDPDNDVFRPFVTFCCEDMSLAEPIMVVLRVWDEQGNHNDCMVEVELQDKLAPEISCPPSLTVSCDYHLDRTDLSEFGTVVKEKSDQRPLAIAPPFLLGQAGLLFDGLAHDNCEFDLLIDTTFNISNCNTGTIIRKFIAQDSNGFSECTQTITIENPNPFYINIANPNDPNDDIIWPMDYTTDESCDVGSLHPDSLPVQFGKPQLIGEDKCDLAAPTFKDETYPAAGDNACFKIIRTWSVVDWCQPLPGNNNYKEWEYEQVIMVRNLVAPDFLTGCEPDSVDTFDPNCVEGYIELIATGEDDCTPLDELQWTFEIDTFSNGVFGMRRTGLGDTIDASGTYPIGTHTIRYSFEDRCGNKSTCTTTFSIINKKQPTLFCKNGLVVDLHPIIDPLTQDTIGGEIEVWAKDLVDTAYHSCGYSLTYSFAPDTLIGSVRYTCDDMDQFPDTFSVTVYVTDEVGNQISCLDSIIVQDNQGYCPANLVTRAVVGGRILTEDDESISNVAVELQGATAPSFMTDSDGLYAFPPMIMGGAYTVVPVKDDDHMNGITTADIIAIQKYLLGDGGLDSPYKLIAADVNGSMDISAKDIIELRKMILGLQISLSGSPSWRLIDRYYVFNDPADPFSQGWPENYNISELDQNMRSVDFTGVKIGDVNGTASGNVREQLESRQGETLSLLIEDKEYHAGELIEVPVYASSTDMLEGWQFTLHFNAEQFAWNDITAGIANVGDHNIGLAYLSQGMITMSWNGTLVGDTEGALFTLKFRALHNGHLTDQLFVSSDITTAEAYVIGEEVRDVRLELRNGNSAGNFILYQNMPNPFGEETIIRFALSEDEPATLTIYDVNGRLIWQRSINARKGMNEVGLHAADLPAAGILYYQLDTRTHSATRKMVLLR